MCRHMGTKLSFVQVLCRANAELFSQQCCRVTPQLLHKYLSAHYSRNVVSKQTRDFVLINAALPTYVVDGLHAVIHLYYVKLVSQKEICIQ